MSRHRQNPAAKTSLHKLSFAVVFLAMLAGGPSEIMAADNQSKATAHTIGAEFAKPIGGAIKLPDVTASGKSIADGQGNWFDRVSAASKLAIRYATTNAGTISVAVNEGPARKVNVHSSGAFTNSFVNAIIELAIPANPTLTITCETNDVAVNIDRIIVGDGDLGLAPDIWNLPPLPVASGPYAADWKEISQHYQNAGVVARREVWRLVALGSAIDA